MAVFSGEVDINASGDVNSADDGSVCGVTVISGQVDINDDGTTDTDDDGTLFGSMVGHDLLSVDSDGDGFLDPGDTINNDDNWNIIGSAHVVRTSGWQPNFVVDSWELTPQFGAVITVVAGPASCQNVLADADLLGDPFFAFLDLIDQDYEDAIANEQCIAFISSRPGETLISLSYHDEGAVADGNEINQPDDSEVNVVGPLIKEWSELVDSVIIRVPAAGFPSSVKDGGFSGGANNHIDDIDWQHNNDIQGTTITSDVERAVKVIEISHGEHQTAFGPAEGIGVKVDPFGIAHVDVDNAEVEVTVTSINGGLSKCTIATVTTSLGSNSTLLTSSSPVNGRTGSVTAGGKTLDHGGALITISAGGPGRRCEEIVVITVTEKYPIPVSSKFNEVV